MSKELIVCVVSALSCCLQPKFFSPERHIRRHARHFVPHTHIYTHHGGKKHGTEIKLHNFLSVAITGGALVLLFDS